MVFFLLLSNLFVFFNIKLLLISLFTKFFKLDPDRHKRATGFGSALKKQLDP